MSPNVGNFVHDLVEMAKAMETLPQVEHERDQLKSQLDQAQQTVQDRELAIINYKRDIEELNAKVRSLEVERDDASFRVLEAEDAAHAAVAKARSAAAALEGVILKLEPPKPEPVKEPEQAHPPQADDPNLPQGQGEAHPTQGNEPSQSVAGTDTTRTAQTGEGSSSVSQPSTSSGQSESHPTASTPQEETKSSAEGNATQGGNATASESHGPYYGKRYYDHPIYLSRYDWHAGGGTDADYDWRPHCEQS